MRFVRPCGPSTVSKARAHRAAARLTWAVAVQDQASRWTFDGAIAQFKVVMLVPMAAVPKILARFDEINAADFDEDGNAN